jgi:hypothetical protein
MAQYICILNTYVRILQQQNEDNPIASSSHSKRYATKYFKSEVGNDLLLLALDGACS